MAVRWNAVAGRRPQARFRILLARAATRQALITPPVAVLLSGRHWTWGYEARVVGISVSLSLVVSGVWALVRRWRGW